MAASKKPAPEPLCAWELFETLPRFDPKITHRSRLALREHYLATGERWPALQVIAGIFHGLLHNHPGGIPDGTVAVPVWVIEAIAEGFTEAVGVDPRATRAVLCDELRGTETRPAAERAIAEVEHPAPLDDTMHISEYRRHRRVMREKMMALAVASLKRSGVGLNAAIQTVADKEGVSVETVRKAYGKYRLEAEERLDDDRQG